jgi:hypothetical protein
MKKYIFSSPTSNGKIVNVTYYPTSGGTINLGTQLLPWIWETNDSFGVFELYFILEGNTCYIVNNE